MSSILYQNEARDILVLDIPKSIEEAQSFSSPRQLASCKAQQLPWPSTEPKSTKAKLNLPAPSADDGAHKHTIAESLKALGAAGVTDFCLPRWIQNGTPGSSNKRQRSRFPVDGTPTSSERRDRTVSLILDITQDQHRADDMQEVGLRLVSNTSMMGVTLSLRGAVKYHLPPGSSFFLSECAEYRRFHESLRQRAGSTGTSSMFEAMILDPPWPNRSVDRSGKSGKAHYELADSMWDLRQLLFDMDLSPLLIEDGIVGVWITNRPAARDLVLSEDDGLFNTWGIELVEEWLWVKVTEHGEPVQPIDGLWRKPYEVLLVGKKRRRRREVREPDGDGASGANDVKRRVIFAVPDVHSRKPCFKRILGDVFALSQDYRGLEIFARYLVTAWTSWGNEVLKFNEATCWAAHEGVSSDPRT